MRLRRFKIKCRHTKDRDVRHLKRDPAKDTLCAYKRLRTFIKGSTMLYNLRVCLLDEQHKLFFCFIKPFLRWKMSLSRESGFRFALFLCANPAVLQSFTSCARIETQGEVFATTAEVVEMLIKDKMLGSFQQELCWVYLMKEGTNRRKNEIKKKEI